MDIHPIEGLMSSTLENIRSMIDVNTVIGDAIDTEYGVTIIPLSKVSFGFVAGGGEYTARSNGKGENRNENQSTAHPFAGGTGAGVSVQPVGFLAVSGDKVRLLPVKQNACERIIDAVPQVVSYIKDLFDKDDQCDCEVIFEPEDDEQTSDFSDETVHHGDIAEPATETITDVRPPEDEL